MFTKIDTLEKRINKNSDSSNYQYYDKNSGLKNLQARLNVRGGADQWTRMRQDKLKSLKKALFSSYQSAIVQKYNVKKNTLANNLISIITLLQDQKELNSSSIELLTEVEQEYNLSSQERYSNEYINQLNLVVDSLIAEEPMFRCLINHDKLKVDYEDKIISIPFEEPPVGLMDSQQTKFQNGTVFKWVHGNKEQWTPDTYWIVYMQYSEETAYFKAEIRKANEQIEIITIDEEGNESSVTYRGWLTGPNETSIVWNVKKGIVWNDMNYTKLLYITKDQDTLTFFQRFDRVIINGKPWQIQAYNENYSNNKIAGVNTGIIRVALKETYTSTDQFVRQSLAEAEAAEQAKAQYDEEHTEARIDGPTVVKPYSTLTYTAKNFEKEYDENQREIVKHWSLFGTSLARIIKVSPNGLTATVEILTGTSNKQGFFINYGNDDNTMLNVSIESF